MLDGLPYGRLLARRGRPEAAELLERVWQRANPQRLFGMIHAGIAVVEWAWLADRPDRAREVGSTLLPLLELPGWAHARGELLRYLARAGVTEAASDAVIDAGINAEGTDAADTDAWVTGLRGDWRAAAEAWKRAGDPYERALELAESGEVDPTLEALRVLDDLGAAAPAALVRRRLRALGVTRIPRRPAASTRAHPAGLTDREGEVLDLLGDGATNAEIAARRVLSVRTVDHHVSSILGKLHARTRREAVAAARALERDDGDGRPLSKDAHGPSRT